MLEGVDIGASLMWAGAKPKSLPPCATPQCDEPAVGEGYCARHLLLLHGLPVKPVEERLQFTPPPDTGRAKWLAEYLCMACGRSAPQQPPATRTCAVCGGSWIHDELLDDAARLRSGA